MKTENRYLAVVTPSGILVQARNAFKCSRLLGPKMRFLIRAIMPTEAGNKAVQDPNFLKSLEDYMNKTKPKVAYFYEAGGDRVSEFVVDMQTPDQMPDLGEPLFIGTGAKVEFHPAMNFEDLKKGISRAIAR